MERESSAEWAAATHTVNPTARTENELVELLHGICREWSSGATDQALKLRARVIGEELNRRGGFDLMKRAHDAILSTGAGRSLDGAWDRIGQWRG
jgi:hypothetical protein